MSYLYYLVEYAFVVRVNQEMTEAQRLLADGSWVDYPDLWDVATNGKAIDTQKQALETARQLFERDARWDREASVSDEAQALELLFESLLRYLTADGSDLDRPAFEREITYQHQRFGQVSAGLELGLDQRRCHLTLYARIGKSKSWVWISTGEISEVFDDAYRFSADTGPIEKQLAELYRNLLELDRI
ncbi:MAG: hypothetical protein JXR96_05040 [Deltaproteobacteria bacterium]|nr:hypothetical protein [Deltaproteobacteria bacterium]